MLRAAQVEVQARLALVGARLSSALGQAFVPLAASEAHITAFVVGFPADFPTLDDDVSPDVLVRQADAVRALKAWPPRLEIGGASSFLSCPILEVRDPHGDLDRARAALAAVGSELRFAGYTPHVTVGSMPVAVPTSALVACLAPLRRLPPITLRPVALELVTYDATRPGATLDTELAVAFNARSPAPAWRPRADPPPCPRTRRRAR